MKNIVIFASGSGSNAENLITHYQHSRLAKVAAVFTNNPDAGVIQRAEKHGVPVFIFDRNINKQPDILLKELEYYHADYIFLAGYLWLLPGVIVKQFHNKILNIHPALLPNYGGKGMYGEYVHKAVLANDDKIHGVTVHLVNEHYDEGKILLQESFEISPDDDLEAVTTKIHEIEFRLYPKAADILISGDK